MSVKNSIIICLLTSASFITGCATFFSGSHQDVKVTSADPALNPHLKLVANTDENRVIKYPTSDGTMDVHRSRYPIEIKIEETECIEGSSQSFNSYLNFSIIGDFIMGSLLSTLIDSSTGAAWTYDDTMVIFPKVKPTEECQKWLKELQEKYQTERLTASEKD